MTATFTGETFDPAMISGFPEPAHRWLRHAIAPGTPLWGSVELTMHGQIKLGRWRPFPKCQPLSATSETPSPTPIQLSPVRQRSNFAAPVPLDRPLHPVQLYESVADFLIFFLLYRYFQRPHKEGGVIGGYLVLYSAARFIIEFFREHDLVSLQIQRC